MSPERSERIREIFAKASNLAGAERTAYLDEACGDDADLRNEVESLLEHDDAAVPDFLDPESIGVLADDPPPERIGKYRITGVLGEGGMGVVYRAEQTDPVRTVALKVIKPGMDSHRVIARFKAEMQAMALMNHPCVAKIFDSGLTEDERPYFVMEYVPGLPITKHCKQHDLDLEQRLELFMQVCDAVQHAHQKGIIHRDIKPGNVLVVVDGDSTLPKVIDFGVAKALHQALTVDSRISYEEQIIGTPEYMSPEQAALKDVDTRSDIYSLGVMLYELLTGVLPFDRESLHAATFGEILRIVREVDPPKPSTRVSSLGASEHPGDRPSSDLDESDVRSSDTRSLARRLRGDLDRITMKALEKDRSRRYKSASDFAAYIQKHLNGEAHDLGPPSAAYRISKFVQRNKTLVAATTTIAFALLLGTGVSTWQAIRASNLSARNAQFALDAVRQLRIETASRLAAQSQSLKEELPVQSLLLAVEAVEATRRHGERVLPVAHESLRSALAKVGGSPLPGHEGGIGAMAVSPDGRWLVTAGTGRGHDGSCSPDNTPRLWDLTRADPWSDPVLLQGHEDFVWRAAFSPDGRWLATVSNDRSARLWDLTAPNAKSHVLKGHEAAVSAFAFSPDALWLATTGIDNSVRLWDLTDDHPTRTGIDLAGVAPLPTVVALVTSDGLWLAAQYGVGVRLWDLTMPDAEAQVLTSERIDAIPHPDGRRLVGISFERTEPKPIRIWDLTAGDPASTVKVLGSRDGRGAEIAMTRDRRWRVTVGLDKMARLWDLTAEDPEAMVRVLGEHQGSFNTIALSHDDRWLVARGPDKTAVLWDLQADHSEGMGRVLHGHDGTIRSTAFSADGRWLATGSEDGTVRLWDLTAEDPEATVRLLTGHEGSVDFLVFNQNSRWLASGSPRDPVPRLWDLTEEDPGATGTVLRGNGSSIWRMTIPPGGRWVVARFRSDPSLRLWDLSAPDPRATAGDLPWTEGMSISADGRWLLSIRSYALYTEVQIRDLTAEDPMGSVRILRDDHSIYAPAISPDGRWLAAGTDGSTVRLWDLTAEDPVATSKELAGHEGRTVRLSFSPDNRWLATSGAEDETTRLWDLTDDDLSDATAILHGYAESIVFSPDGRWLLTRGDYRLQLWRISDHDPVPAPRKLHVGINVSNGWYDEAFGPDSRWLVTRTRVTTAVVKLWDLSAEDPESTGRVLRSGDGWWPGGVIVYSPDGRWLVTDGAEGTALLDLNADDPWTSVQALRGHSAVSAAFSPDSHWLATLGLDGTARLWDLSAPVATAVVLRGHEGSVRAVAFSSDSRWLCTGSDDGTIRLWDMRVDALMQLAKRRAGRGLTSQEADRYHVPLTPLATASLARESTSATPRSAAPLSE